MRVYELAKELGVVSKELLVALKDGGFTATNHMAVLSDEAHKYLAKKFAKTVSPQTAQLPQPKEKAEQTVSQLKTETYKKNQDAPVYPQKPVTITMAEPRKIVVEEDFEAAEIAEQERIKKLLQATAFAGVAPIGAQQGPRRRRRRKYRPAPQKEVVKEAVTAVTIEGGMPLFEVADFFGKQSGDLILFLLKKGMVCNRNNILSPDIIKELGNHFGITVQVKADQKMADKAGMVKAAPSTKGVTRWPVVVVMGHVDHGKTTLLDYMRKMNVAATEKGGITQHISAWEVDSTHGKVIFLDTPGHEAFSYMRERGAKITDLVVLVVAVDDGIKTQTIEAIKHAKAAQVPIIVAVNKIDKMSSPSALETIKRQLSQHELMPEEWGGQTVVVPISAKTGQGINELLEMIVLQSQLLDLKAEITGFAKAFVLESNQEKGYGPVATVIVTEGTLKVGDYFVSGNTTGKVRILINSLSKKIREAGPSIPVQVVGFDSASGIGDWLTVVSQQEYSRARSQRPAEVSSAPAAQRTQQVMVQPDKQSKKAANKFINLLIKTDTRGSKEAITGSLEKLGKEHKDIKCPMYIVSSSIGDITESDVELAENTGALILGLHVKVEKNAQLLARELGVEIKIHQIIYHMVEDIEKLLLSKKEVVITWNKVGEAVVKKVFDIKGSGIIAGCYLRDGVLTRGNKVICVRNGKQIGEAKVVTLQRDRKAVKEIHSGYECGFTAEGFDQWEEGDTVLCYAEVKEKPA